MTSKPLVEPTSLFPMTPKREEVRRFENHICEDNALKERYKSEITTESLALVEGLTGDQKRHYHVMYTEAYHRGIEETLALFIGKEPAALFMEHAKVKHEKVYAAKEAKAKGPTIKPPKKPEPMEINGTTFYRVEDEIEL